MNLWRKITNMIIEKKLILGKGAKLVVTSDTGTQSTIDMAELAALDAIAASDLAKIDGITNGTVAAGKAAVVDSNKDIGDFRNLDAVNIDAGASGTAGSVDVFPTTASKGKASFTCTDQTGDTTVDVVVGAMAAARTITLRDPGAAASILTTTDGTAAATDATALEITRSCDASARIVTSTATVLGLTVTQHGERVVLVNTNSTVANTFTLPTATGSGVKMTLINNITQTQGTVVFAANGTDVLKGVAYVYGTTTADAEAFVTSATSDKITLNLTTTGGLGGDIVEAWDTAANVWNVQVKCVGSGSLATPFSQT